MRFKSSQVFAIALGLFVVAFFAIGSVVNGVKGHKAKPAVATATDSRPPAAVQIAETPEEIHPYTVTIRGRTEATRTVAVRSETAGIVSQTPAVEGHLVGKGQVLCALNVDARAASLDQARAALRSRILTQQASEALAAKGYRSRTQLLQDQAALDGAKAAVRQAEIALEQTNIRAPFAGTFDKREAEIGTYLAPGQSCGTVIELTPILIVGDISESDVSKFAVGAPATAKLISGEILSGQVRYLAHDADPQTRTYHLEVTAENRDLRARAGLSADLRISAGAGPAHRIPLSALVLDSAGRQGVRFVGPGEIVGFAPVTVIEETDKGIYVSGLKSKVRVITVGQSYVGEGQKVQVGPAR